MREKNQTQCYRPKVSIIVPCYNYAHLLAETLQSVRAQTLKDWECVVVDDGSTDDTASVVAQFAREDNRFQYLRQDNQGLSAARNTGIRNCRGEMIQFLDADDLIESYKLEQQVAYLEKHGYVDIVYGSAIYFQSTERVEGSIQRDYIQKSATVSGSGDQVLRYLLHDNFIVVSSPLIRRRVVEKYGCFDESLRSHEDWEFWLRCALASAVFHYVDLEGGRTRIRLHAQSMSKNSQEMANTNIMIRKRLLPKLETSRLRAINFERFFANVLKLSASYWGSSKVGAIKLIKQNWPRGHGLVPSTLGLVAFAVKAPPKIVRRLISTRA